MPPMLAIALPLSTEEKKIAPASRTALIGVETFITKQLRSIKTPAAMTAFWDSLAAYSTRNHINCTSTPAPAMKTKAKSKTRTAGASA